jgi:hypothetical protein
MRLFSGLQRSEKIELVFPIKNALPVRGHHSLKINSTKNINDKFLRGNQVLNFWCFLRGPCFLLSPICCPELKGQFHNKMHLFGPFWLYKSPFLGCLTHFWSFRTVSLWKVALFNPKAMGLVLQTKWCEVSLGLAKSPGSAPTDRPAGAIFLLFELQKSFLKSF